MTVSLLFQILWSGKKGTDKLSQIQWHIFSFVCIVLIGEVFCIHFFFAVLIDQLEWHRTNYNGTATMTHTQRLFSNTMNVLTPLNLLRIVKYASPLQQRVLKIVWLYVHAYTHFVTIDVVFTLLETALFSFSLISITSSIVKYPKIGR